MPIRCVYTDLDGTLLGREGSLLRDADGAFTLMPVRALEACHRAGVEVVLKSGRRKAQVSEDARLIGQRSYIYEVGCGLVVDGEETLLIGELKPGEGETVFGLIESGGAPALLLERYAGRLEHHSPWHLGREISHLFRGLVDAGEANELLERHGHSGVRLVDNGAIAPRETLGGATALGGDPHVYHLIPAGASKANAVARHRAARGYTREECIAVGDSREDVDVAEHVGRFFLVANGLEKDPDIEATLARHPNVEVTEARNGDGFYEAVVGALMEARR
jgi:hydroxymethylpyrimidine pyrophosphatase-like HAD family hydrolase